VSATRRTSSANPSMDELRGELAAARLDNARLLAEAREALERQTALAEVLRSIAGSPTDVTPVLQAIAANAARFCGAEDAVVHLLEGERLPARAHYGSLGVSSTSAFSPGRTSVVGLAVLERRTVHVPDVLAAEADEFTEARTRVAVTGHRGLLAAPLMREGSPIGGIVLRKGDPSGFTPRQIELVEAFATQAVIAIENVRLFNETKEALDRQTAVGEVLAAIGRSGFDPQPVFELALAHAGRLCSANAGGLWLREGDLNLSRALWSDENRNEARFQAFMDFRHRHPGATSTSGVTGRVYRAGAVVQIPDVTVDPDYPKEELHLNPELRTLLGVPLLKDRTVIGVMSLARRTVTPFSDHDIALVRTFADQAVLAIENARLLQAVERQRQELTRFVSPQVAALLTSDEGQRLLEGHRRAITVLFCDLRGFSAFSETAEPEEVLAVLREYHAAMGELIIAHGGTLEHFAGDGMMVFFNDPVPVTDHELQAVRLAVAMRGRFEAMAQAWHRKGYELGFGVGAAVGHATLGRIGFEGRYDYGAIGNAVIVASRLSGEAKAGQILLTQRLHAAVEQHVEAEAIGELSLKGQTRPVAALNLIALRGAQ